MPIGDVIAQCSFNFNHVITHHHGIKDQKAVRAIQPVIDSTCTCKILNKLTIPINNSHLKHKQTQRVLLKNCPLRCFLPRSNSFNENINITSKK